MRNQLHVVADASTTSGGEGLAALRYAESVALAGSMVTVLSKNLSGLDSYRIEESGVLKLVLSPSNKTFFQRCFSDFTSIKRVCGEENIELIHLHGMWTPYLAIAALVAKMKHIPVVISPHGCLEPWALSYKKYKKTCALKTYQGVVLRSAAMFIATAVQELEGIRKLGLTQPIAVIPNGVDVGFSPKRDLNNGVKKILFLSRIHPKKGLLDLVEAWAIVRKPDWKIVIAGGDEGGYRASVEALIREKGLQSEFEFTGFVDGVRKQACFDEAEIFVLPTYSENFGIAVAEAMANELPVITTTGAPWHDLVEYRCGWWVEPGVHGVSYALKEAMACTPEELRNMGKRARQLVIDKYSWLNIGVTGVEVSNWILNQSLRKPVVINLI